MKKIFAFLLIATLTLSMFVMPSAAVVGEEAVNYELEIDYIATAPEIDGEVKAGEYGDFLALHSFSENPEQFNTEFDQYGDWDTEFYAAWDEEFIYMAWVVTSDIQLGMPNQDMDSDGDIDATDYNYMWTYSCAQFIFTPGDPTAGVDYTDNYMEIGLTLLQDNTVGRALWKTPMGINKDEISLYDWNATVARNEEEGTTTYEIAVPKMMSGLSEFGTGAKFGLAYAVAAQEDFNTKQGMLEWQDGILGNNGVKVPNNCAVVTFVGGSGDRVTVNDLQPGEIPEEAKAEGIGQITLNTMNEAIVSSSATIITDFTMDYNAVNAFNAVLAPVEGEDGVFEVVACNAADALGRLTAEEEALGTVIVAVHGGDSGENAEEMDIARRSLTIGSKVKLFGVDVDANKLTYTNPMVYTVDPIPETITPPVDDPSEPPVDDSTDEPSEESSVDLSEESSEEPSVEPSEEPSDEPSVDASEDANVSSDASADASTDAPAADDKAEDDGGNTGLIIGIIVAVVAVIAVVVVIVVKKKK